MYKEKLQVPRSLSRTSACGVKNLGLRRAKKGKEAMQYGKQYRLHWRVRGHIADGGWSLIQLVGGAWIIIHRVRTGGSRNKADPLMDCFKKRRTDRC